MGHHCPTTSEREKERAEEREASKKDEEKPNTLGSVGLIAGEMKLLLMFITAD